MVVIGSYIVKIVKRPLFITSLAISLVDLLQALRIVPVLSLICFI